MKKGNQDKVLEVFFDNPTEKFYIREIARITKLNPNTIINISEKLIREGLIRREKKEHVVELSADLDNENFKNKKRLSNFRRILECGIVNILKSKFDSEVISIIGSYSRGEDIGESDIDIVVMTKKEYEDTDLKKYEKILNRDIHLIVTDYTKISDEFYTNLLNGIILYGYMRKK